MCVKSERQAAGWIQSSSLNFMARVKATKDMGPQKHVDGWLHIPSSFHLNTSMADKQTPANANTPPCKQLIRATCILLRRLTDNGQRQNALRPTFVL